MTEAVAVPASSLPGGVEMPMIGFGTWQLRGRAGRQAVTAALQAGYRHIDTATMYGNEGEVGHALAESGLDRDSVFLTTKLPSSRADRVRAVGVSNYSLAQIDRLTQVTGEAPAVSQIPWSPARHDPDLLAAYAE